MSTMQLNLDFLLNLQELFNMKTLFNLLLLVVITFCTLGNARVYKSLEDLYLEPASGNSVIITSPSITANQPLKFGASKEITSGLIDLTSDVTLVLPVLNGGTGTSATAHTNLTTNVNGILPVANGGTGSTTQNFVDLTSNQAVSGTKTFNNKFSVVSTTEPSIPCPTQTTTQRDAVGSPVSGDCVYNSTTNALNIYNGSSWTAVGSGGGGGGIAEWVTSTGYSIDDVIFTDDKIYVALTNHTAGTFATDLTNNEWSELSPFLTDAQVKTAYENNADTNALTDAFVTTLNATSGTNTGDLSNAQIKTNYEANADTNALTDAALVILGNTSGTNTGNQDLSSLMTNPLTTTGDILYATSGSTTGRLAIGTDAQVLTLASGVPTWASPAGAGVGSGGSSTDNTLPRWNGTAGDTLQDSSVLLSDLDALTGITSVYVSGSDASVIPFTIRGANQTANFLEVETHDGTNVLEVDSNGHLRGKVFATNADGFNLAPIGGDSNIGIVFAGTGDNSTVTIRAGADNVWTFGTSGLTSSGSGIYGFRSGVDGLSTSPGYTFDNDRNTGMYRNGSDTLAFSAGGTGNIILTTTEVQFGLPLELSDEETAATPPSGEISIHNDSEVLKVTNDAGIKRRVSHFEPRDVFTNPSFEDSDIDNGWTITSGTASAELTTIVPSEGEQALELAVSASAFEMYQTFDCSDYDGIPLGFSAYVSATPSSELEICGFDGTTDLNCTSLYTSSTSTAILGYQKVLAENTGGGTCGIKFKSDATITETIHIDGVQFTDTPYLYVNLATSNDFRARLTSGGVVSDENEDFINGNCTNAHPSVCTFVTGKFTEPPHCTAEHTQDASAFCIAYDVTATGLNIKCYTDAGGSASNSYSKTLQCSNTGADYKTTESNVVTPTKSNMTGWTAYTPTTQGFGTETSTQYFYKVIGDGVMIAGNFDSGTVAASEVQLGLPSIDGTQLTVNSAFTIATVIGEFHRNTSTSTDIRATITGGDAFINASQDDAGYKTAQNGSTIFGSTESITFSTILIPTNELSGEDYFLSMIPILTPSVNVSATEVLTENDNNFITSCTNADPSVCTFSTSYWKADPKCWANPTTAGEIATVTLDTTTSVTIDRTSDAGPFTVFCTGKKN